MAETGTAQVHKTLTPEQESLVLDSLRSVMSSPQFSKSKRYPALLEYVVRAALNDHSDSLKERIVGVEVFGRPADYDTDIDPVVRTAAAEVRRRTSMYFSEHPDAPVRIELPPGGYKAEFHFRPQPENGVHELPLPSAFDTGNGSAQIGDGDVPTAESNHFASAADRKSARNAWLSAKRVVLAVMVGILLAGLGSWRYLRNREQQDFWWPVLHNNQPAMILVGPDDTVDSQPDSPVHMVLDDSVVAAQVCSIFSKYKQDCTISPAESVSVADIRNKPVISIGGFNNPWTLRLLTPLSYQLQLSGPAEDGLTSQRMVVENTPSGQVQLGKIGPAALKLPMSTDYAIVARFHSDVTDGMAVVVAGLGRQGTHTGGLYVCSPDDMRTILSRAPKGWKGVNFEAVLKIDVIQGSAGHVEVIATKFW